MSAVAGGSIGAGGLGDFAITYGYQTSDYAVTLVAVITIIVLVQLAQMLGNWLAKRVMRR
jgi:D-methionine transport system permease protein